MLRGRRPEYASGGRLFSAPLAHRGAGLDVLAARSSSSTITPPSPSQTPSPIWPSAASISTAEAASITGNPRSAIRNLATRCGRTIRPPTRNTPALIDDRKPYALYAARPVPAQIRRRAAADRGGRTGQGDRQALHDRCHELRSISKEAHETLAIAMNRIGGMSNTGEAARRGALQSATPTATPPQRRQADCQRRFGVTTNYMVNADELQIKMAQVAKPARAASCPATRSMRSSPQTRHSIPGVGLISRRRTTTSTRSRIWRS